MIEGTIPSCPKCGCARSSRVKRKGIMQTLVWHRFGYYPWECGGCRAVFGFKNRGRMRRTGKPISEVNAQVVAARVPARVQVTTRVSAVSVYPEVLRF